MKRYIDLIEQSFDFPTKEFKVKNNILSFHGIPLMDIIENYGTPLKITYLPSITEKIQSAKSFFNKSIRKYKYKGNYTYTYCTKSSHFNFVLDEALKNDIHIETSSAFDISIIRDLYKKRKITKKIMILCNGFKRPQYKKNIVDLLNDGFKNCIPILDNKKELDSYVQNVKEPFQLGIRVAADEEPNFEFYTSRLGMRYKDIVDYYQTQIKPNPKLKLKMLHIFINTGIRDSAYYWTELSRFVYKYCELKKVCPELDTIDIGGGFPIKKSLDFEFDYQYVTDQIVENIQSICKKNKVDTPHIVTEFGSYTVGESGATIYSILDQKLQNDKELWYMIDGSLITQLPDIWGQKDKYITLPINNWNKPFQRISIGGLTCDSMDYYNSERHGQELVLPETDNESPLYIGFFNTGAYQESLSGYGGIQHCLIPAPKHIIVNRDKSGKIRTKLFAKEQSSDGMLEILGY